MKRIKFSDWRPTCYVSLADAVKKRRLQRERLHYLPPSKDRWKLRSTTYIGIAEAMA